MTEHKTGGGFPYDAIADYQNWGKAIRPVDNRAIDPHAAVKFQVTRDTRIASAGSCFAERLAESLRDYGFNYYVTEPGLPWLDAEQKRAYNYGTYSARYGNLYSSLQLLQLLQRALGEFTPVDEFWTAGDHVVDPFRPSIQPEGFATPEELARDRDQHFAAVRELFTNVEVFIFTLGLTETWCSSIDGAAFPSCPGKQFGTFDPERYTFRNLSVSENVDYLRRFLELWRGINPDGKMILTVSPVPLVATMEDRHILQAATYSKCVLRVVAEEMRRYADVEYFASYEIATATLNNHTYFDSGKRNVTPDAVEHVMRSFFRNFAGEDLDSLVKVDQPEAGGIELGHLPCEQDQLFALLNS